MHAVAQRPRNGRLAGERLRAQQEQLPVRKVGQFAQHAAHEDALGRPPFEDDDVPLLPRAEALAVDAFGDHHVAAGKANCCSFGSLLTGRNESVESPQQPVALGAAGGIRESSGERKVATASPSASRNARYESEGSPGSKPCTTSKW